MLFCRIITFCSNGNTWIWEVRAGATEKMKRRVVKMKKVQMKSRTRKVMMVVGKNITMMMPLESREYSPPQPAQNAVWQSVLRANGWVSNNVFLCGPMCNPFSHGLLNTSFEQHDTYSKSSSITLETLGTLVFSIQERRPRWRTKSRESAWAHSKNLIRVQNR